MMIDSFYSADKLCIRYGQENLAVENHVKSPHRINLTVFAAPFEPYTTLLSNESGSINLCGPAAAILGTMVKYHGGR